EGMPDPGPGQRPGVWYSIVSVDYFRAMGMRLLKGRLFTESDNENAPYVTVVSESMARRCWPNEDPIGKRIKITKDKFHEVIGVGAEVKHFGFDKSPRPEIFLSDIKFPSRAVTIAIRAAGDPLSLASAARREINGLDKSLAVSNIMTMERLMAD